MAQHARPWAVSGEGVSISVRVTPKVSGEGLDGVRSDAAGSAYLAASVNAPAVGGKANAALLALFARSWRILKRRLVLRAGAHRRHKAVFIAAAGAETIALLEESVKRLG